MVVPQSSYLHYTRINSLSWVVFMDSDPATWCISVIPSILSFTVVGAAFSPVASHSANHSCSPWPFYILPLSCSQNQYHLGDSHTLPGSAASTTRRPDPLWTTAYMYWPWENIPRRFCLRDAGLLITMSLQSKGFIFVILSLVNHINSSAPADKNQILNLKYVVALIELLGTPKTFFWNVTSQAPNNCMALNTLFPFPTIAH